MSIWALLPFKGAGGAKRRLAAVLSEAEREGLVLAMLRDVLAALANTPMLGGVVLASRDSAAAALADEFGAEVFPETASDLSAPLPKRATMSPGAGPLALCSYQATCRSFNRPTWPQCCTGTSALRWCRT